MTPTTNAVSVLREAFNAFSIRCTAQNLDALRAAVIDVCATPTAAIQSQPEASGEAVGDVYRRTLEIIAVGDAANERQAACDALIATGFWLPDAAPAVKPEASELPDLEINRIYHEERNKIGRHSPILFARACVLADRARQAGAIAQPSGVYPRVPTDAMLTAARDWSVGKLGRGVGNDAATGCWQAMYDAAAPQPPAIATTKAAK